MSSDMKVPAEHPVPIAAIDPIDHKKKTTSET